jgi:hypothetical protein
VKSEEFSCFLWIEVGKTKGKRTFFEGKEKKIPKKFGNIK